MARVIIELRLGKPIPKSSGYHPIARRTFDDQFTW